MSIKEKITKEAEKYSQEKDGYFQYATKWSEVGHIFSDGVIFGYRLAVEELRNHSRLKESPFGKDWAKWLERRIEE